MEPMQTNIYTGIVAILIAMILVGVSGQRVQANTEPQSFEDFDASMMESFDPNTPAPPNEPVAPDFEQFQVDIPDNQPQSQPEAIEVLRRYIANRFGNKVYRETQSVGDLEIMIRQQFLFTNQELEFIVIPYHINKDFNFDTAEYRWRVLRGDEEIFALSEVNKQLFYFDFFNAGTYQIEVEVTDGEETYQASIPFDVYDQTDLTVNPETPAAGDTITITADYAGTEAKFQWKVDDTIVDNNSKELSFREYKGVGREYFVQLSILTPDGGRTLTAGGVVIEIPSPRIRMTMMNAETQDRIAITSQTIIEEPMTVLIQAVSDYFNKDARLEYVYRVNGKVTPVEEEGLLLEIDPERQYQVDVFVRDTLQEGSFARRELTINPQGETETNDLQASIGTEISRSQLFERYLGLGILGVILVLGVFLSRNGRLIG